MEGRCSQPGPWGGGHCWSNGAAAKSFLATQTPGLSFLVLPLLGSQARQHLAGRFREDRQKEASGCLRKNGAFRNASRRIPLRRGVFERLAQTPNVCPLGASSMSKICSDSS